MALTQPEKLKIATRRYRVLELRRSGMNFYGIADHIRDEFGEECPPSYDARSAYVDLQRLLDEMRNDLSESLPDVISLEASRLDEMLQALWPAVVRGRERSIEIALKVMERRAQMLGLDAGIKVDWRIELIGLVNAGAITQDEVRAQLGEELFAGFLQYIEERAATSESSGILGATPRWSAQPKQLGDRPLAISADPQTIDGDFTFVELEDVDA